MDKIRNSITLYLRFSYILSLIFYLKNWNVLVENVAIQHAGCS